MSKAKNEVIAGDYKGRKVLTRGGKMIFEKILKSPVYVDITTVESYEIIDKENSKSLTSALGRGFVGSIALGGLGMVAGLVSAKSDEIVLVAIKFKNGDKSLIEIDSRVYKELLKILFI